MAGRIFSLVRTCLETGRLTNLDTIPIATFISIKSSVAVELNNGWTLVGIRDGYVTQHEHTILVTDNYPVILTASNEI